MRRHTNDRLKGTLDLLVLKTLASRGRMHGYAINPARDLGPRLVHAILPIPGKGSSNWTYAPIPIVGDLAGGALAGLLLHYARL